VPVGRDCDSKKLSDNVYDWTFARLEVNIPMLQACGAV
jgi:hypothetical protein